MNQTPVIAVVCVLAASLLGAAGQFLFKLAADRGGAGSLGFLRTPWAFIGLGCYLAVMFLFSVAFRRGGTVTVLYPVYATTFVWAAVLAWILNGQPIRPIHAVGMLLLIGGMVCMGWGNAAAP
jgi:multidrug transporter EmrE-like cation transporter